MTATDANKAELLRTLQEVQWALEAYASDHNGPAPTDPTAMLDRIRSAIGNAQPKPAKKRGRGRPPVADKRRTRGVLWNDREWSEVKARAEASGLRVFEYCRQCALGTLKD